MSFVHDRTSIGDFIAQHHDPFKLWKGTKGSRRFQGKLRFLGFDITTGEPIYDRQGWDHGGVCWLSTGLGENLSVPVWQQAMPGLIVKPALATTSGPGYQTGVIGPLAVPALRQGGQTWQQDVGLVAQPGALPLGLELPYGHPVVALGMSTMDEQQLALVPAGGILIAVKAGVGKGRYGTKVFDVTQDGGVDPLRWARDHSHWNVYLLPQFSAVNFPFILGKGSQVPGGLAWELGPDVDGNAGHGVVSDLPALLGIPEPPADVAGIVYYPGGPNNPGVVIGTTGVFGGYTNLATQEKVGNPPPKTQERPSKPSQVDQGKPGILGVSTYRGRGPLNIGEFNDPHRLALTPDGKPVNSLGLDEGAIIRGDTGNAPRKHDRAGWQKPRPDGPFAHEVYHRNDLSDEHEWFGKKIPGLRKWQGTDFQDVPTPRYDPPAGEPTNKTATGIGGGGYDTGGFGPTPLPGGPKVKPLGPVAGPTPLPPGPPIKPGGLGVDTGGGLTPPPVEGDPGGDEGGYPPPGGYYTPAGQPLYPGTGGTLPKYVSGDNDNSLIGVDGGGGGSGGPSGKNPPNTLFPGGGGLYKKGYIDEPGQHVDPGYGQEFINVGGSPGPGPADPVEPENPGGDVDGPDAQRQFPAMGTALGFYELIPRAPTIARNNEDPRYQFGEYSEAEREAYDNSPAAGRINGFVQQSGDKPVVDGPVCGESDIAVGTSPRGGVSFGASDFDLSERLRAERDGTTYKHPENEGLVTLEENVDLAFGDTLRSGLPANGFRIGRSYDPETGDKFFSIDETDENGGNLEPLAVLVDFNAQIMYLWGEEVLTTSYVPPAPVVAQCGLFGDGSDGVAVFNGGAAPAGTTFDGAITYTQTRDVYYTNLTMSSFYRLVTNGWRTFVSGTTTLGASNRMGNDGGAAVGMSGGTAVAAQTVGPGGAGSNGISRTTVGTALGVAGVAVTDSFGGAGGTGGSAVGGGLTPGGTGGAATAPASNFGELRQAPQIVRGYLESYQGIIPLKGGAGGGTGGVDYGAGATGEVKDGAGGGGGGVVMLATRKLINAGIISADGGPGGAATNGGGTGNAGSGGGGGGGGGLVMVVYESSGSTVGTIQANGGSGGPGAFSGTHSFTAAANGSPGRTRVLVL